MVKFSNKLVLKYSVIKQDRVHSKFWTKNHNCPFKSGTVTLYERDRGGGGERGRDREKGREKTHR